MIKQKTWRVAVLPGDGVGAEVMREGCRAINALCEADDGPSIECTTYEWPSHNWYMSHGEMAPVDFLEQLSVFDAILFGALGDPGPTSDPNRYVLSDSVSLAPLLDIRRYFDLWACERPCKPLPGAPRFLRDPRAAEIDMLVIRENSEGEYVGHGGRLSVGTPNEIATQTGLFSHRGTERIIRHAFERARKRAEIRGIIGTGRQFGPDNLASQVCLVTKRNALKHWGDMYTEIFGKVSKDYPDVAVHHELVDAACAKFITSPWAFDVVVASNLHGDILTDLAAVLNGGMGVSPSCNINPSDRTRPPMFEPTHGSAPDIVGQGLANPTAMLLTTAMMLAWMGEEDPSAGKAADRLTDAVAFDLLKNGHTARPTDVVGNAVISAL